VFSAHRIDAGWLVSALQACIVPVSEASLLSASLANVVRCHDVRVREVRQPFFQYFLLKHHPYGDAAMAIEKIAEPLFPPNL